MKKLALSLALSVTMLTAACLATAQEESSLGGSVSRMIFSRAVVDHEPVDDIETLATSEQHIYLFTELKGLSGETIFHRWEYGGKEMASIRFEVGGPRWRVWSSKTLLPQMNGTWTVKIVTETGHILSEKSFQYGAPDNTENTQ